MNPVIMWFRRDLRLEDNTALVHALESNQPIIPVFVLDDAILASDRSGTPRLAFMLHALASLQQSLQKAGGYLLVLRGKPETALAELIVRTQANHLYFNTDYSPYARQRDEHIGQTLVISVTPCDDVVLIPPQRLLSGAGKPYTVYTPYKNAWNNLPKPHVQTMKLSAEHFYLQPADLPTEIPTLSALGHSPTIPMPPATETHAAALLDEFFARDLATYSTTRNTLPIDPFGTRRPQGTSYLSPYLRLGIVSPRVCYWQARDAWSAATQISDRDSIQTWVSELTWREFYVQVMYHYPHVLQRDFVTTYAHLEWRDAPDELDAWKNGMTGYPVVDAPMRQLQAIGWMPNRARMIVASFLTKHLLIHWLPGDKHFMQHLIDGDPAANNGGWQWSAGTGTDAQPYFRIFNPMEQSRKFATPAYLKHWLPELNALDDKTIHTPWEASLPPHNYPAPIVDHAFARHRTLSAFKKARELHEIHKTIS